MLLLALAAPLAAQEHEPWVVSEGRVVLAFHPSMLADLGLELRDVEPTAEVLDPPELERMEGPHLAFALAPRSDLRVLRFAAGGGFVPYGLLGGAAVVEGGFALASPATGRAVDFSGFRIHPLPVANDGPGGAPDPDYVHLAPADEPAGRDFDLCYVKIFAGQQTVGYGPADHDVPVLTIKAFDLVATAALAEKLGRPDVAGRFLGVGKLEARIVPWTAPWSYPRGQNPFTPYSGTDGEPSGLARDVSLGGLASISNVGHAGPFGAGRTAISMATTSCNLGTTTIEWLAPDEILHEDHPGIAMQLYREWNGRFEQVGRSWVKHGFFATMGSTCTPCQGGDLFGTFLGLGCSDTYGVGNNADRFWLGPREEWNPYTGTWRCEGSWFDGDPVDCVRDEDGFGQGFVNHRLEAFDAELGTPGARYFYEAMYLVRGDEDVANNIGHRQCTIVNTGTTFGFATPGDSPLVHGPAVLRWGQVQTVAGLHPHDGDVVLAADVRPAPDGRWRYEYALFNWTLDRRVRSFAVPSCGAVSDVAFKDVDQLAENDWVPVEAGGLLCWEFPDVVVVPGPPKQAGALEFGTLYNFGFTSSAPPGERDAVLGVHDPGPGGDLLLARTRAPAACLHLGADEASPAAGSPLVLRLSGGRDWGIVAVVEVGGMTVAAPPLVSAPAPFTDGRVELPVVVPAFAAGLDFVLVGADVTLSPFVASDVSNRFRVAVP